MLSNLFQDKSLYCRAVKILTKIKKKIRMKMKIIKHEKKMFLTHQLISSQVLSYHDVVKCLSFFLKEIINKK